MGFPNFIVMTSIKEHPMEKNMEHEMETIVAHKTETGIIDALYYCSTNHPRLYYAPPGPPVRYFKICQADTS